jgi:hypothetical protein
VASAGFGHPSRNPRSAAKPQPEAEGIKSGIGFPSPPRDRSPRFNIRYAKSGHGIQSSSKSAFRVFSVFRGLAGSRRFVAACGQFPPLQCSAPGATPSTLNSQLSTFPTPSTHKRSSAWGQLPWVQFLRSDPFYARLVNTYLLTNALWVLVIHASFSNRFAYLSWFMMPWVLLYPFVTGKVIHRPQTGFIAAILFAHYLFTYLMVTVVYPLRGGGLL